MQTKIKVSKYSFLFRKGRFTVLYHALTLKKVYGMELLNGIFHFFQQPRTVQESDFSNNIIKKLVKMHFLIPISFNEEKLRLKIIKATSKIEPITLKLLITNKCNYHCDYCQIEENIPSENKCSSMSMETARKALGLFIKNCPNKAEKTIIFTGGEPLLNLDVLKFLVDNTRRKIDNARIVIFTNGSLITEEIARYFKSNNVLVLISLDGPKDVHNKARRFKSGKGTYSKTLRGYKICQNAGCEVGISSVIGKHNLNKVTEMISFFADIKAKSVGLNFPHYLLDKKNPHLIDMEIYVDNLLKAYKLTRREGLFIEQASRKLKPFIEEIPRIKACDALGKGITVTPEGIAGPCKTLLTANLIGKKISEIKDISKDKTFKKWSKRSTLTTKECQGCPCVSVCGTGCTYDSYALFKDIYHIDPRACTFSKKFLEFMIWDLFEIIKRRLELEEIVEPNLEERRKMYCRIEHVSKLTETVGHQIG